MPQDSGRSATGERPTDPPSGTDADDCLSLGPFGRVEGRDGVIERRHRADVRPQSPLPDAIDDRAQLGAVRLDDEIDRVAVDGPRLGWANDGDERASAPNQGGR